jgi:hypothetical protein
VGGGALLLPAMLRPPLLRPLLLLFGATNTA